MQLRGIDERAKVIDSIAVGKDVTTGRCGPFCQKLAIIDKDIRASRGVRTIFKIVYATVPEKRGTICVKENGREAVVLAVENELAGGSVEQRFGKRTRR